MNLSEIKEPILSELKILQDEKSTNKEVYFDNSVNGKNEFLFFIKPEITMKQSSINLALILDMISQKFKAFDIQIKNIRILNSKYLDSHQIIASHYGVINAISNSFKKNANSSIIEKFEESYDTSFSKEKVLGSIEFLKEFPYFEPIGLDYLWQNSSTEKLGGGIYCQKLILDGNTIFLVNGFHPRQLEHFTSPGRSIIVMTLTGNTDWNIARNSLIGKTSPAEAETGSIRNELLVNKDLYGLKTISPSWNGVHLSAGPIEALVELVRYNSNFEENVESKLNGYNFGKKLIQHFGKVETKHILTNPNIKINGKETSVFDLTEEMNSKDAIDILGKHLL